MMSEPVFSVLKKNNPNYDKIGPVFCSEGSPNTFIPVYRKGMDPKVLAALRSLLAGAHKDKDMGVVRPFLEAANIKFVDPSDDALKQIERLYRQAEDRGWMKEAKVYMANYDEINAKKSAKNAATTARAAPRSDQELHGEMRREI